MTALLLAAVVLAGWEFYVRSGAIDELLLPAPSHIGASLVEDRALLLDNLAVTATEVGFGIAVALVLGLLLAISIHLAAPLRRALYPVLVGTQAVPIVVVAPLLVVWLGFGLGPKLAIIALICFFPIAVTTLDALRRVDPALVKVLRTLDATRWQRLRFAEAPAALPGALSGAKVAVAVAVIGAVLAESSGSEAGLGHLIDQSIPQLQTARAYAAVVLLAALAVVLFFALHLAERRLTPWAHRSGGTNP